MTITTKFNLHDKVYIIEDNSIRWKEILYVSAIIDGSEFSKPKKHIRYGLKDLYSGGFHKGYPEESIFRNKEELIDCIKGC